MVALIEWTPEAIKMGALSALALLVWEFTITIDDEISYVWSISKISRIKVVYMFLRYIGILFQIANSTLVLALFASLPVPGRTCSIWYAFQTATIELLLAAVELVQMIRVYALYNRNRWIGLLLFIVFSVEFVVNCVALVYTLKALHFDYACVVRNSPAFVLIFGATAITTQFVIWVLTLYLHIMGRRRGWGRTPLSSLFIRDGLVAFVLVSVLVSLTVLYAALQNSLVQVMFSWSAAILSTAGCRLITNMQRLVVREPAPVEFTTFTTFMGVGAFAAGTFSEDSASECAARNTTFSARE